MAVLVTGGTGFIGSNIMRFLIDQEREAIAYDMSPLPILKGSVLADVEGKFKVEVGSANDLSRILAVINKHNIDGIIHAAAMVTAVAPQQPLQTLNVNIIGTANILEAARLADLGRVVIISSNTVVGSHEDPNTPVREEKIKLPPSAIYPLSKLAMEYLVYIYRKNYDVDTIAVRPKCVYGPGPDPEIGRYAHPTPIWEMVADVMASRPIIRETGADAAYEYTYVKDFAKGILQAYDCRSPTYHVYNLSSGVNRKVSEVCAVLKGLFPNLTIQVGPGRWQILLALGTQKKDSPQYSAQLPLLDIRRAREDFGYKPEWDINRAIPDWVDWLRERIY